ncbi:hypothetical protein OG352_29885 [Streptomyces sp. NBC_01485]|uniref:hypothetical protein n=1 Tax=Streptomyces sp. NBC_01485 TaxID=2903884 RepID=UPI002E35ED2A|nr:hypothetical protein [Streptomyces sp. NBC_01485]
MQSSSGLIVANTDDGLTSARPAAGSAGDYPDPIVDLSDGLTRFERARGPAEA